MSSRLALQLGLLIGCGLAAACAKMDTGDDAGADTGAPETGVDASPKDSAADVAPVDGQGGDASDAAVLDATDAADVVEAGHDAGSLDTELVGLWNLDETAAGTAPNNSDFADESGQGHHGVASNAGVTFGLVGVVGRAVNLDGTLGYITLGANAPQPTIALSAAAWIKANTSQGQYPQIVSVGDASGLTGYNLYLYNPGGQGVASFIVKEGSNGWGACWAQGTSSLRDDAWHHVVGVYGGTDISIYVDGTLQTTTNCANQAINYGSSPSGEIGAKANASAFGGNIDQVGLWSRALTTQEITALYGGGSGTLLP